MSETSNWQRKRNKWRRRVRMSNGYRWQWMPLQKGFWLKTSVLLTSVMLLLTGCASAPSVCPRLPDLPVQVQPGESFQSQMARFLSGSLPEPTSTEPQPLNAKQPTGER